MAITGIDVIGLIGIIVVSGAMYYLSSRIEPHWVSKDRTRFLTVVQELDQYGLPIGRKREVRGRVDEDGDALLITRRSLVSPETGVWIVDAKSSEPPRGRIVYVLKKVSSDEHVGRLALRVPEKSKIVPRLDELLDATGAEATLRRERERRRAAQPPPDAPPGPVTGASGTPESPRPDPPADRD